MSTSEEFDARTDPYRRELLAHCYRMLGSIHDAEDVLQETMLRAWRAWDRFDESRASLRTWLYRIATNACLTALQGRGRRPLPSGLGGPSDDPWEPLLHGGDVPWLQPFPDAAFGAANGDPANVLAARGSLRLAFLAAMQLLPARQRAVLILRDVLDWPAAEVAEALDTTPAAVNSALQRARARLDEAAIGEDQVDEPDDTRARELVTSYVTAFENADIPALTRLLAEDVILEMPPMLNWYVGRQAYGEFIARVFALRGTDWRMIPTSANGQLAVGAYLRGEDGAHRAHTLQVFTIGPSGISRNTVFQEPGLFEAFGLPAALDAPAEPAPRP
ncbi:sigma-70 family RNA polymerase sigma factor [Solihabitans fulvus]|uniref:RNA polymerase sigma factor n=1 Tax=Solihabitans fulvus TaxID=1892852 RepID=A0A5B2WYM5_9PSEU|nr:sigma-70 family RNA polymerase sigma factor [Solihabitans fulvus]KAA2256020.1 sigma-70 family RNA polymerase sigma factor [Solihabitans fulvus]